MLVQLTLLSQGQALQSIFVSIASHLDTEKEEEAFYTLV